ncbi:FecCD family ABC transporter permease [Streptomyces otsuchiensis]|uniref:FecCD family ABC transporter permease n=1 Tax=Streptomyces otsuchiensis TaxID=2681388 RepID=UPI001031B8BB|nr:iron ABC transporter permease [Streptomyces otsuchiensis]
MPSGRGVRPTGHTLLRVGTASFLVHRRSAAVAGALTLLLAVACVASLCWGRNVVPPGEVLKVVFGAPSDHEFTVGTLRLPRLATGLLVGAALGVAGGLIQTVARNPLASPDIIGVTHGAAAVTVAAMTYGLVSADVMPYVSIAGGLLAGGLVYLLAWRGGMHAARFVLIGIGCALALRAVTQLLLTKGDSVAAQQAVVWMTGSLNGRGWDQAVPLAWALLVLLPLVLWAARAQRTATLDDATATALGVRIGRLRLGLAGTGILLAALATGAAGPVDFVALLAPQVARRLTRGARIPLLSAGLLGALIVVVGDMLARMLLYPTELPVGVLTAAIGAPYLIWLIARGRTGGKA